MAYSMHRVFCATPGMLEDERQAFYETMADINRDEAMPRGILMVSVSLPANLAFKSAYQSVVDQNVRDCRFYVQILEDTWGPPERSFHREYKLAHKCLEDPQSPMEGVA